jgi:hypothetical protein
VLYGNSYDAACAEERGLASGYQGLPIGRARGALALGLELGASVQDLFVYNFE